MGSLRCWSPMFQGLWSFLSQPFLDPNSKARLQSCLHAHTGFITTRMNLHILTLLWNLTNLGNLARSSLKRRRHQAMLRSSLFVLAVYVRGGKGVFIWPLQGGDVFLGIRRDLLPIFWCRQGHCCGNCRCLEHEDPSPVVGLMFDYPQAL